MDLSALFQPFSLKTLRLPNRIAMAPMTRSKSPGQVPGPDVAAYYRRRAEGGVGLIITEGTSPAHAVASNDVNVPRFHGEDALAGWANVLKEVKAAGGAIMPQLWHVGLMRRMGTGPDPDKAPVGPSGLFKPGKKVTEPMTDAEVADVIKAFAVSAAHAHRLGFDGIEIHGAHGYIIDQFFWSGTNERADRFGGNQVARANFAAELVRACRKATAPDFPILLRWSQWKQQDYAARLAETPDALAAFLRPLVDAGVDMFHCSTRRFWEPEFDGSDMNLAGWVKKLAGLPTITVGSVGLTQDFITSFSASGNSNDHLSTLLRMFGRGDFDLVAVGRALIANPDWPERMRRGDSAGLKAYDQASLATLY